MTSMDSIDDMIIDALPDEIAEKIVYKVHHGVKKFLSTSYFVKSSDAKELAKFDRDELELGRILGSGGFSQVREILHFQPQPHTHARMTNHELSKRQRILDRSSQKRKGFKSPFVVKQIHSKFLTSPSKFKDAALDLMIEAHFLASLSHPCILGIKGWTSSGARAFSTGKTDSFFLILERLEITLDDRIKEWKRQLTRYTKTALSKINGGNLQELLFSGRLKYARDIASGLAHLHDCGIIYRDLKPGNIGFDSNGQIKIFDFGLSREMPRGHDMSGIFEMSGKVGTQRYMAPEVYLCKDYGQKADVYSLSLVVWEMLALNKPFKKHSKMMHKVSVIEGGQRPDISKRWPYGVQALLISSWSEDMNTRPTMEDFHAILIQEIVELRVNRDEDIPSSTSMRLNKRSRRYSNDRIVHPKLDSMRSVDSTDTYYSSSGDAMVSMDCERTVSEY
mmetsp:Transcript_38244/g.53854  ORF Transcript_38244/g.53854 Transcript_38244/m.53854 type:complete len:449 (-) Transcript_38244:810-2156(-)